MCIWTPLTDESVSTSMWEDNERYGYTVNDGLYSNLLNDDTHIKRDTYQECIHA